MSSTSPFEFSCRLMAFSHLPFLRIRMEDGFILSANPAFENTFHHPFHRSLWDLLPSGAAGLLSGQWAALPDDDADAAQGQAAEIRNQAEAYRQTRVNAAQGEAQRFLSVLREYEKAEDVTKKRMLYETMEEIMSRPGMEKLVLPSDAASRVLPLLPLGEGFSGAGRPLTGNVPASDAADRSSASVSEPFSPPSSSSPVSAGSGQASPRVSRQDGDVRARAAAAMPDSAAQLCAMESMRSTPPIAPPSARYPRRYHCPFQPSSAALAVLRANSA